MLAVEAIFFLKKLRYSSILARKTEKGLNELELVKNYGKVNSSTITQTWYAKDRNCLI